MSIANPDYDLVDNRRVGIPACNKKRRVYHIPYIKAAEVVLLH